MTAPAPQHAGAPIPQRDAQLALCLAQRAFAALIEHCARNRGADLALRSAQLRSLTRRTLSALSADDRTRLARWLALQFAARNTDPESVQLARVDARLSARVNASLAPTREELAAAQRSDGTVAA